MQKDFLGEVIHSGHYDKEKLCEGLQEIGDQLSAIIRDHRPTDYPLIAFVMQQTVDHLRGTCNNSFLYDSVMAVLKHDFDAVAITFRANSKEGGSKDGI